MSKITYGMMQSLDGYIEGPESGPSLPVPDDALHRHFNEIQKSNSVELYGRGVYEVMRYWGTDDPQRNAAAIEFAEAWRETPKVVFSTTLQTVSGPNTTLAKGDIEHVVKKIKADTSGDIGAGGAGLAASLSRLGLIDEYRIYMFPIVLGGGKPFFALGSDLQLELIGTENLPQNVLLMRYRRAG